MITQPLNKRALNNQVKQSNLANALQRQAVKRSNADKLPTANGGQPNTSGLGVVKRTPGPGPRGGVTGKPNPGGSMGPAKRVPGYGDSHGTVGPRRTQREVLNKLNVPTGGIVQKMKKQHDKKMSPVVTPKGYDNMKTWGEANAAYNKTKNDAKSNKDHHKQRSKLDIKDVLNDTKRKRHGKKEDVLKEIAQKRRTNRKLKLRNMKKSLVSRNVPKGS